MAKKKHINNLKKTIFLIIFAIIISIIQSLGISIYPGEITNSTISSFDIENIPEYEGSPYVIINNNKPTFEEKDYTTSVFEVYSNLDSLGRCGVAFANICKDIMPSGERESISSVKPSGWKNKSYPVLVDGD